MTLRFPHSIRWRITMIAALAVAVVLTATAFVLVGVQRSQLLSNLDASLQQRADDVSATLASGDVALVTSASEVDRFVQVLDADGAVVAATPNVVGMGPAVSVPASGEAVQNVAELPVEDDDFRVLGRRLADGSAVIVGENIDDVRDATRVLAWTLVGAIPAVVLLMSLVVWGLVGRTLRPVEEMRSEVAAVRPDALSHRVAIPVSDDEIRRLAQTMNAMLDRVEEASVRQERFVADASHELRSPLTRLRTSLEVELAQVDPDLEAAARDALADVESLQVLVDDLLAIARSDAGSGRVTSEPVDLDDIVLREARRLRERGGCDIDTSAVSGAHLRGSAEQLLRLVRNVCDNAYRHAESRIVLTLAEESGRVVLAVEDDGPGVAPEDVERMFERFTRLDEARSNDSGRSGLGLAIVRDIAERHGGTATAERSPLGGLRLLVRLSQEDL